VHAIRDPQKFSLTSIAVLQQSASSFRYPLEYALQIMSTLGQEVDRVKRIYEAVAICNKVVDGNVPYSPTKGARGMSLEARYVLVWSYLSPTESSIETCPLHILVVGRLAMPYGMSRSPSKRDSWSLSSAPTVVVSMHQCRDNDRT
jgi:hypothetical protein